MNTNKNTNQTQSFWLELNYSSQLSGRRLTGGSIKNMMQMLGLTLYRVKNGFDSHGDREDWVIDLPTGAYAVSDTDYISGISQISKPKAKTFKVALIVELADAKARTIYRISETEQNLAKIKKTLNILNSVKI